MRSSTSTQSAKGTCRDAAPQPCTHPGWALAQPLQYSQLQPAAQARCLATQRRLQPGLCEQPMLVHHTQHTTTRTSDGQNSL